VTVRREPDAAENAATDPTWKRWTRFRTRNGVEECHAFERRTPVVVEEPARRLRGSQSEPGHHLGRGTKFIKPRTKT
jgi:hypothetical protein